MFMYFGGCPIIVHSMAVIEDMKLRWFTKGFVFWYRVTLPGLTGG